jgi:hypothetical protein
MQGISRAHLVSEEPLWGPALDDHCQRQRKSHHTEIGSLVEIDPKKIGLEGKTGCSDRVDALSRWSSMLAACSLRALVTV